MSDILNAAVLDAESDAVASTADTPNIDAAAVAAWLQQHPQFFHHHSALLLELSIPHETGKAISLLERQVALFRERQEHLQDQFHEFLTNAHANDNLFEKTRHLILALLRCNSLAAVVDVISERIKVEFSASASGLMLVNEQGISSLPRVPAVTTAAVRTALGELYQRQVTYCGPLNQVQRELLFPQHPELLVSAAIVPIKLGDEPMLDSAMPLLLIASAEREHFNSSLDTLFLDFLGEVLAVHLQNLLVRTHTA
jgi:uncharacterized protein YigA (DUF484 family)